MNSGNGSTPSKPLQIHLRDANVSRFNINIPFAASNDYNTLSGLPYLNGVVIRGHLTSEDLHIPEEKVNTKEFWDTQTTYKPSLGEIVVYTNRTTIDNVVYAGIKIGDGTTFLADLPFFGDDIALDCKLSFIICTQASNTPYGVTWNKNGTTITGTLVASDNTKGIFYLVPSIIGTNNVYIEYITVENGASFSWEKIGATDEGLANKADKADTVLDTTLSRGRTANSTVGTASFAFGDDVTASGNYAHAEGKSTIASGANSHAEGGGTYASAYQAHAEGGGTDASGQSSHAEGRETTASGNYTHAEGDGTTASGNSSHAEGGSTAAYGIASHAEGGGTKASGDSSHAEGGGSTASGNSSHAEGSGTSAYGTASHSEGGGTQAQGTYSHAEGTGTIAVGKAEHVSGRYNVLDTAPAWVPGTEYNVGNLVSRNESYVDSGGTACSYTIIYKCKIPNSDTTFASSKWEEYGQYLFVVGNGTADNARSNAAVIDWDGNERLKGNVYVGCNADSTGGTRLATISELLALGETSSTAYRGDRGAAAYAHAVTNKGSAFESGLYKITTNSEGHVTSATAVAKSDITALGIPAQDTTYESKQAAPGGTAESLVTTGEKYTWDQKPTKQYVDRTSNNGDTLVCRNSAGMIARYYDPEVIYYEGDLCSYVDPDIPYLPNDYRCSYIYKRKSWGSDTPVAESFTTAHWNKIIIDTMLKSIVPMTGATASTDGSAGLVPTPSAGDEGKFLRGDGTWQTAITDISGKADKVDTVLTTTLSRGRKANTAVGIGSFAFGNDVEASDSYSHAEGYGSQAKKMISHAEGFYTIANGKYSHVEGFNTEAHGTTTHTFGKFNVDDYSIINEWVSGTHYYVGDRVKQTGTNSVTIYIYAEQKTRTKRLHQKIG